MTPTGRFRRGRCYSPLIATRLRPAEQQAGCVDLHFKLGLGQFLEKRYTSIETFAA